MAEDNQHGGTGSVGIFGSSHDFLQTTEPIGQVEPARLGRFRGELSKGIMKEGELQDLTKGDLERGTRANTLIIVNLINHDRPTNFHCSDNSQRTGKFAAFMDELEEATQVAGYQYIWVDKVVNEFLRKKFESRGYVKVSCDDHYSNPDYVKVLR